MGALLHDVKSTPLPLAGSGGTLSFACSTPLRIPHRGYTTVTRPRYQSWARNAMRQWMCPKESCRSVNPAVASECGACGTAKPKLQGWKCIRCETRNHRGVTACKKCKEPFTSSRDFWMCAVCEKNNRIDELEDNSRCGYCSYDMAPLTHTEERIAELRERQEAELQSQQEGFDSISAREADEQLGDSMHGADSLPPELARSEAKLTPIPLMKHYEPKPIQTRHSSIYRRQSPVSAAVVTGASSGNIIPPGPPGFDWMCCEAVCGQINPGDEENCLACGHHIAPAAWECPQCAALNHLSRSRCFNCHAGIPVKWDCPACPTASSIYVKECRQCKEPRPPAEPREKREVWEERETADHAAGGGQSFRRNDWYCPSCNGQNFAKRVECYQCGTPRPARAGAGGHHPHGFARHQDSKGSDLGDGSSPQKRTAEHNNWICRHCQASNFRTRRSCWQCDKEAPNAFGGGIACLEKDVNMPHFDKEGFQDGEDSKPAEGRMNVWKKTDEWVCAKCFSKNFRGKEECFKCGASRSLAVSPRRANVRKPVKL